MVWVIMFTIGFPRHTQAECMTCAGRNRHNIKRLMIASPVGLKAGLLKRAQYIYGDILIMVNCTGIFFSYSGFKDSIFWPILVGFLIQHIFLGPFPASTP